jgi:hypothetical protein
MLDFPNTPTTGQIFVAPNGVTYQWDGVLWKSVSMTGGGTVDFYATLYSTGVTSTFTTLTGWTLVSGNSSGSFTPSSGQFRPPAGRYFVFAYHQFTAAGGVVTGQIKLRKNGVDLTPGASPPGMTTGNAGLWGQARHEVIVDCNGTDVIDAQAGASTTTSTSFPFWFGAFSIPDGKPAAGFVGVPWRQIGRVVPTAGQATVDFVNLPSDINSLDLRWDVTPVTSGPSLNLRFFDQTGTIDAGSNYSWISVGASGSQALNSAATVNNALGSGSAFDGIRLTYNTTGGSVGNVSGIRGRGSIDNIRDGARNKSIDWQSNYINDTGTALYAVTGSGWRSVTGAITGVRLFFGGINFAAGGAVSLWGSP